MLFVPTGVQAFSTLAKEQQEVEPDSQHLLSSQPGQQWQQRRRHYQELLSDHLQQQQQHAQVISGSSRLPDSVAGQPAASTGSEAMHKARQAVQQDHRSIRRFKLAAKAVMNHLSAATGGQVTPEAAAAIAARAIEKRGVPVLMQVRRSCSRLLRRWCGETPARADVGPAVCRAAAVHACPCSRST